MDKNPQKTSQTATASYNKLPKEPTTQTIDAYNQVLEELNFTDTQDFQDAGYNFIATLNKDGQIIYKPVDEVNIKSESAMPGSVWNLGEYSFLNTTDPPPYTINPSLWRQAQLNLNNGLFKVTSRSYEVDGAKVTRGIYQVRAFDLSNMTIVETNNGIIVIDPLISAETAETALNLYYQTRSYRLPVVAVIYTHSHVDHYGGVKGVLTDEALQSGTIPIYAPDGFLDHAVSENVYAGSAMDRRSIYMYGTLLPKKIWAQVDSGLGKTTSVGQRGLIPPTEEIKVSFEPIYEIDGVQIVFQLAPDTEAPSEMLFHFPQFKALCAAEDMTHNLHNLYSLRGAQVRNAAVWWKVINDTISHFADQTEVLFAQHHWPIWNNPPGKILNFLKKQRNLYKYIHDQSLRLLNHGWTMIEISEMLSLPDSLSTDWFNRGYYGTVNHDSKAVYQRYMGWYDANPATLHTLPPVEASKKYVEYMGGAQAVLDRAQQAFDAGDYRWVAEVLNHVIFASSDSNLPDPPDPTGAAKLLQADALEQMGYQAESGPWRNCYLSGADELRHGVSILLQSKPLSIDIMSAMNLDQYFDYMGLRFNASDAQEDTNFVPQATINWIVNNTKSDPEFYALELIDYTLPYTKCDSSIKLPPADLTLTMDRNVLDEISTTDRMTMTEAFKLAVADGKIQVKGDSTLVTQIFDHLDTFPADFNIVTPRVEKKQPQIEAPVEELHSIHELQFHSVG